MIIFSGCIITFITISIAISAVLGTVTDFDKSTSNVCKVYFLQIIFIQRHFTMGKPIFYGLKSLVKHISFVYFLDCSICIVRSNFRKCTQFVGQLFQKFAETTTCFYISMLFSPILVSLDRNVLRKKLEFCAEPR